MEAVKSIKTVADKENKMDKKVILISIDGLRPDGLKACGHQFLGELEKISTYTYDALTVFPSVTLPCHYSMTHSVDPSRHGILTNTYVPEVRPVKGLFEKLTDYGKVCGMYYSWEELRNIVSPGTLRMTHCLSKLILNKHTNDIITERSIQDIEKFNPDFFMIYLGDTDSWGHNSGWMSEDYLNVAYNAVENVKRIIERYSKDHTIIIMADHGGHDRIHGTQLKEDMIIPLFFIGEEFEKNKQLSGGSILDIAPTVAKVFDIPADEDWEGKSII